MRNYSSFYKKTPGEYGVEWIDPMLVREIKREYRVGDIVGMTDNSACRVTNVFDATGKNGELMQDVFLLPLDPLEQLVLNIIEKEEMQHG